MSETDDNGKQPAGMDDSVSASADFNVAEFKANLNACLKSIKSSGTFVTFRPMKMAPDPGIYLMNDAMPISLPLTDEDAKKIKIASQASQPPKGEKISPNPQVWEIFANDLEIRNVDWEQRLRNIVFAVCSGFGLYMTGDDRLCPTMIETRPSDLSAKLSKLVLCEEGGALHESLGCSANIPGTFATICITLPSQHSGGEVTVTQGREKKSFDFSQYSKSEESWIAWFVDVKYETDPILTGRRIFLQYKLVHTTNNSTILEEKAKSNAQNSQIHDLFSSWKDTFHIEHHPKILGYVFEHRYLRFWGCYTLEGQDYHIVSHLRDSCEEYGLSLYIAELEIKVSGVCDDNDGPATLENGEEAETEHVGFHTFAEQLDRHTVLRRIYDPNGNEIDRCLDFNEECLMQEYSFVDVRPDEEYVDLDEEGDPIFDDSGAILLHHIYRRTIALIMPKSHQVEFRINPYLDSASQSYQQAERGTRRPKEVDSLIEELYGDLAQSPGDPGILHGLEQICKLVIRRSHDLKISETPHLRTEWHTKDTPFFPEKTRNRILSTCVDIGNKELFLEAYDLSPKRLPLSAFRDIGVAIARFDINSILPELTARLSPDLELYEQFKILQAIWDGLTREASRMEKRPDDFCRSWIRDAIFQAVSHDSQYIGTAKHGYALACCCRKLASFAPDDIITRLLPVVKKQIEEHDNATNTAMAFLASIFDTGAIGTLSTDLVNDVYAEVMPVLADRFSIGNHGFYKYDRPEAQQIDDFLEMFDRSYQLGLSDELCIIVSKLTSKSMDKGSIDIERFDTYLLPLLKRLTAWLSKQMVLVQDSLVEDLFQGLLPVYIQRFVKEEPQPPTDWARPKSLTSCICYDHAAFNKFLLDPAREVGRFVMSKWRQNHIQAVVDKTNFYTDVDRSGNKRALIVVKNHQDHFIADHEAWQKRKATAIANIKGLGSEAELRALLGDLYESIIEASTVDKSAAVSIVKVSRSQTNKEVRGLEKVAKRRGKKRKIIDSNDENTW
ncbi:hypothetical protein ONS95_006275 [Cadophora gregata]|uniref:uncharacterized protein n=1 Tax=Cadophora gregata TaxID=51156 RepID=UPI0026DC4A65|nr:uncharacterized protein ONS95_006275 [Cadophora gregata]KAK0102673.1 hypothetical protein ONS95_006275 [Cadophora gregata]KAK0104329.1 hypothetical protein ONS96_005414 [Cadophora gregata f. sp. sojae]